VAKSDDQPDDLPRVGIEHATLDQETVHDRVEIAVIDDIVDVSVDVAVHPASGDRQEVPELRAARNGCASHRFSVVA